MKIVRYENVSEFLDLCTPFLIQHETENNLLFGILYTLTKNIHHYGKEKPELIVITENGNIIIVAIRTPPYNQLISFTENLEAIDLLVDHLTKNNTVLPGILGFTKGSSRFSQLWSEKNEIKSYLGMHERIYHLTEVNPTTIGDNVFTFALEEDKELISGWKQGFIKDCFPDTPEDAVVESAEEVEKSIKNKQYYLLKVNGKPVSMVKSAGLTPNGQTINAVYTPLDLRNNGYATELVAKISQKILDEGKKYCFLFTDLANPTSNKIYQEIGYRPVIDVDQYKFIFP